MIDLNRYFEFIESKEYAAELSSASGYEMFVDLMEKNLTYNHFRSAIRYKGMGFANGCDIVIRRIKHILEQNVDCKYENPYDTALATYVRALESEDHDAGMCAAQMINDAKQIWWARQVANVVQDL